MSNWSVVQLKQPQQRSRRYITVAKIKQGGKRKKIRTEQGSFKSTLRFPTHLLAKTGLHVWLWASWYPILDGKTGQVLDIVFMQSKSSCSGKWQQIQELRSNKNFSAGKILRETSYPITKQYPYLNQHPYLQCMVNFMRLLASHKHAPPENNSLGPKDNWPICLNLIEGV